MMQDRMNGANFCQVEVKDEEEVESNSAVSSRESLKNTSGNSNRKRSKRKRKERKGCGTSSKNMYFSHYGEGSVLDPYRMGLSSSLGLSLEDEETFNNSQSSSCTTTTTISQSDAATLGLPSLLSPGAYFSNNSNPNAIITINNSTSSNPSSSPLPPASHHLNLNSHYSLPYSPYLNSHHSHHNSSNTGTTILNPNVNVHNCFNELHLPPTSYHHSSSQLSGNSNSSYHGSIPSIHDFTYIGGIEPTPETYEGTSVHLISNTSNCHNNNNNNDGYTSPSTKAQKICKYATDNSSSLLNEANIQNISVDSHGKNLEISNNNGDDFSVKSSSSRNILLSTNNNTKSIILALKSHEDNHNIDVHNDAELKLIEKVEDNHDDTNVNLNILENSKIISLEVVKHNIISANNVEDGEAMTENGDGMNPSGGNNSYYSHNSTSNGIGGDSNSSSTMTASFISDSVIKEESTVIDCDNSNGYTFCATKFDAEKNGNNNNSNMIRKRKKGKRNHNNNNNRASTSSCNKCTICQETFSCEKSLNLHIDVHLSAGDVITDNITATTNSSDSPEFGEREVQRKRRKDKTPKEAVTCRICGLDCVCPSRLRDHMRKHTGEKPFLCNVCGKKFVTQPVLRRHAKEHEEYKPYPCSICNKRFAAKANLVGHQRLHERKNTVLCPTCNKAYRNQTDLKIHLRSHTGEKPFVCHCGKRFVTNVVLRRHERSHAEHRPFPCSICPKRFAALVDMRSHMRAHPIKDLPLQCYICSYDCADTSELSRHIDSHSLGKKKSFTCEVCNKVSRNKSEFEIHKRRHTGERPFPCTTCGKTFVTNVILRKHQRSHATLKPFACEVCPKRFAVMADMKSHMRSHPAKKLQESILKFNLELLGQYTATSGGNDVEKKEPSEPLLPPQPSVTEEGETNAKSQKKQQYKCSFCDKKSSSISYIKTHEKNHVNGKICYCNCGKMCSSIKTLIKHEKRIHNIQNHYSEPTPVDAENETVKRCMLSRTGGE